jgi:lipoate-protein ligase B
MSEKVLIVDPGTIAYQEAWDLQHRIHEAKQAGRSVDVLLLLEQRKLKDRLSYRP